MKGFLPLKYPFGEILSRGRIKASLAGDTRNMALIGKEIHGNHPESKNYETPESYYKNKANERERNVDETRISGT